MSPQPGTPYPITVKDLRGEPFDLLGRATGVPGLVANMSLNNTGEWGITHERSGLSLGWWTTDPELAIRYAHAVAEVADWTLSAGEIRTSVGGKGSEVRLAAERLGLRYGGRHEKPNGYLEDVR